MTANQPTAVAIPTDDLRALFDIAVGSMNFTSGFLDSDEVNLLRKVAVIIGVDPMVATPKEFARRIAHPFTLPASERLERWPHQARWCRWCERDQDTHPAADEVRVP